MALRTPQGPASGIRLPVADAEAEGSYFVSAYPPFSCWSPGELPELERALGRTRDGATPLGLYVHIPFCEQRCSFCYYLSYDDRTRMLTRYLDAVVDEMGLWAAAPAIAGRPVGFVYFGGGTPSLLSPSQISRFVERLQERLPWSGATEISFECAPKSVTADKVRALAGAGVTRVSLGIQELDDRVLETNGRVHRVADVERAWGAISDGGFAVRNVDLIAGLPRQTDASFRATVERVVAMAPESVTIYQLEIPFNTPLARALRAGEQGEPPAPWPSRRERLGRGFERLEAAGYSVRSGYTAVRDIAAHRFVYQDEQYRGADLLGVGASAFSYIAGVHQQNVADLDGYLRRVAGGERPSWRAHRLNPEERLVRELVLQLKLGSVDRAAFRERRGADPAERCAEALDPLEVEGWLTVEPDAIRLTRRGLLRVDRLLPRLYLPRHRSIPYS